VVVEGYVDVIAMVGAGFEAAVAPLGTALTENQLALLWRMSDEPILCFDGDKAGQNAAFRAADLALPHLRPGKSLRFALLPEGQDPDDLARSGGRGAVEEVIAAARPLADILWLREIESGAFATPERRAALEARIRELAMSVRDEVVRKYYRQDFAARLERMFAPAPARDSRGRRGGGFRQPFRDRAGGGGFGRGAGGRRGQDPATGREGWAAMSGGGPYQVASPQLATSALLRGQRSALPRREALILQSLINHPWLLHDHIEEIAALDLVHADAQRLREAIIAAFSADHHHTSDDEQLGQKLRSDLAAGGFSELLQRLERTITTGAVWAARPGAAQDDVLATWHQLITLHHQWNSLTRELKDAERALAEDATDHNFGWLCDVKQRLSAVEGTEALIEGFGESSGRLKKTM
jgi:DNA primase